MVRAKPSSVPTRNRVANARSKPRCETRGSWHERETQPPPGIQVARCCARLGSQRIISAIKLAHIVAQTAIRARAAELFDPRMFIGRHGLSRKLPANPIGFFGQNNGLPAAQSRQSARDAARSAANNGDLSLKSSHKNTFIFPDHEDHKQDNGKILCSLCPLWFNPFS